MISAQIMPYLIVGCVALFAAAFQASTGIGYAIIGMSFWPMFMPFRTASVVECISVCLLSITLLFRLRKYVRLKLLLWPLISTVVLLPLGLFTMMSNVDSFMRRLLGGLLLFLSIYFIFFGGKIHVKPNARNGLIAGAISGFMGGMFSIGGPPLAIYFLSATNDKNEYNGTMQAFVLIMSIYHIILHLVWGNITSEALQFSVVGAIGLAFGSVLGFMIFKKLSMPMLKRSVYSFMAIVGIYLIIMG